MPKASKTHSEGEAKQNRINSEPEAKDEKGKGGGFFWKEGGGGVLMVL
ncbi:hypothetical protein AB9P05_08645 [Roseivirga sp. BDSF3-8]